MEQRKLLFQWQVPQIFLSGGTGLSHSGKVEARALCQQEQRGKMCWRESPGADPLLGHQGDDSKGAHTSPLGEGGAPAVAPLSQHFYTMDPAPGKSPSPGPSSTAAGWMSSPGSLTDVGCAARCQQMVLRLRHSPAASRCAWLGDLGQ